MGSSPTTIGPGGAGAEPPGTPGDGPGGAGDRAGLWPGPWPAEDAGPRRTQAVPGPGLVPPGGALRATTRVAPAVTMVVTRGPGELFLLRHTAGDAATATVERIDPVTLEPLATSGELPGGPTWPGSIAAHASGRLVVVFGNHAHLLDVDLTVRARTELPRPMPYNGFVVLPDGAIVTKDFAGSRPGRPVAAGDRVPCELVVLDPQTLQVADRCAMAEPSVARLSADGDTVYVVGDTSLLRARWDGRRLVPDGDFRVPYRTLDGQTYGWDCVLVGGAAWFLDDGEGSEAYSGTLRGNGTATAPLHLVRVDLASGRIELAEVCGRPGGLVANPPVIDERRSLAVAYDSGNGVIQAFTLGADGTLRPRWQRHQDHGGHLLLWEDAGQLLTGDHDAERGMEQAVVIDVDHGTELARIDTGSPVQGVLFPAAGFDGDAYWCTFVTVTRLVPGDAGAGPDGQPAWRPRDQKGRVPHRNQ